MLRGRTLTVNRLAQWADDRSLGSGSIQRRKGDAEWFQDGSKRIRTHHDA